MRELYDPTKKAVYTITPDGTGYDSGFEARVGYYTKTKLGVSYDYENSLAYIMEVPGGQYKPDYGVILPDGSLSVIEVKGWKGDRVELIMELMKERVDDPADNVSKYTVIWSRGIEIYDGNSEDYVPGAVYVCPDCGKAWLLPKHAHDCPNCGARCDYDCCNVNEAFNAWWKKTGWGPVWTQWLPQWSAAQEQIKASAELDERYGNYLLKTYPGLNLRKQTKYDKDLAFLTRFAFDGTYLPDLYYYEPRANVVRFGTALDPLAVVVIDDYPSNNRAALLKQMTYFVNRRDCPVVKLVHIDHNGIHVCDKHNPHGFSDGAIYRCDDCGKEYFASKAHHDCPCCDSASTTKISK